MGEKAKISFVSFYLVTIPWLLIFRILELSSI